MHQWKETENGVHILELSEHAHLEISPEDLGFAVPPTYHLYLVSNGEACPLAFGACDVRSAMIQANTFLTLSQQISTAAFSTYELQQDRPHPLMYTRRVGEPKREVLPPVPTRPKNIGHSDAIERK